MSTTKIPKGTKLRQLKIDELSLVDRPANPGAFALLTKRDTPAHSSTEDPAPMDQAQIDQLNKRLDALATANETLATANETLSKTNTELKTKTEALEKSLEAVTQKAQQLETERAEQNRLTLAKSMVQGTPIAPEAVTKLLTEVSATNLPVLQDILTKYRAALKTGAFAALGSSATGEEDGEEMTVAKAQDKLEELAKDRVQKSGGKVTAQQAYLEVCSEHPDLYNIAMDRG